MNDRQLKRRWHRIVAVLVFALTPAYLVAQEEFLEFTDDGVETVFRRALGLTEKDQDGNLPKIPRSAVEGLVTLNARRLNLDPQIKSTEEFQYAKNLRYLDLTGRTDHRIGDEGIAHLAQMTQLQWLYVGGNDLTDIAWVASLTNLEWFAAQNNPEITSIEALAGLTKLQRLYLGNNSIADLAPLASLTELTHLYLELNALQDSHLAGIDFAELNKLHLLSLNGNRLSTLMPLSGHPSLKELYAARNRITDHTLIPMDSIPNLQRIDIRWNILNLEEGTPGRAWFDLQSARVDNSDDTLEVFRASIQGDLWVEAAFFLDTEWRLSSWMGYIHTTHFQTSGWTWVHGLGWLWADPYATPNGVWFYSLTEQDWYWTNDTFAPYAYKNSTAELIEWVPDFTYVEPTPDPEESDDEVNPEEPTE